MIITKPDGTKISSKNENFSGHPNWKCPNCGCVYFGFADVKSLCKEPKEFRCNECDTEMDVTKTEY